MTTSKVVQLLKTFTPSEWTSCGKYLAWQFKVKSVEFTLFNFLKGCKKDWDTPKLDIEFVKKKVAKNLTHKDFLSRRSKLKLAVESFLLLEAQKDKERKFDQQLLLGELYKKRGLYVAYSDLQNEIKKEKENLKIYDINTDLKIMQWCHHQYFSETVSKDRRIQFLQESYRYLDHFYQSLKIFYETEAENLQLLFNQTLSLEEQIDKKQLHIVLLELKKLVTDNNKSSFKFLKSKLLENWIAFSPELQQVILLRLINACHTFIRKKDLSYKKDIVELFEFGLATKISLNNGKLSESRFLNMVDVKSKLGNTTTTTTPDFIEEWLLLTETNHSETLRQVAFGLWYFAQEEYALALDAINDEAIVLKDMNIKFRVRIIKLCCFSSLEGQHNNFIIELKSARAFFRERHKNGDIGKNALEAVKNLISIITMFWKQKPLTEIQTFKDKCRLLATESWVEKRLKQLAQKNKFSCRL